MKTPKQSTKALSSQSLACRDLGHAWSWNSDYAKTLGARNRLVEISRSSVCIRCNTIRFEVFEVPSFTVKGRYYVYPDGYLTHGVPKLPVAVIRAELFRRLEKAA